MKEACILLAIILLCGCAAPPKETTSMTSTTQAAPATSSTVSGTSTTAAAAPTSSSTPSTTTTTTLPKNAAFEVQGHWAHTTPVMDGIKSEGEWSDAKLLFSSNLNRFYVKNNDISLFFLYEALDSRQFSNETSLYVDPDSDGLYDYAIYDNKIFLVYPLVRGFSEHRVSYCGSHLIIAHENKSCGKNYEDIMEESRIAPRNTSTSLVSEVSIPLGNRTLPTYNDIVYFFVLYGHPTMTCYPESAQCYDKPKFAALRLAKSP